MPVGPGVPCAEDYEDWTDSRGTPANSIERGSLTERSGNLRNRSSSLGSLPDDFPSHFDLHPGGGIQRSVSLGPPRAGAKLRLSREVLQQFATLCCQDDGLSYFDEIAAREKASWHKSKAPEAEVKAKAVAFSSEGSEEGANAAEEGPKCGRFQRFGGLFKGVLRVTYKPLREAWSSSTADTQNAAEEESEDDGISTLSTVVHVNGVPALDVEAD
mmetsp:Transcript_50066/g.127415  ORF Transcript_50066/g.127415 Transcript_50066/m.127415 type:complete len:215 (-) Transcript_50066:140-784(-)